jgi:CRP/FNR family transcriptional regulator
MLSAVPAPELEPLADAARARRYRPGDLVVAEGDPAPPVLLLLEGRVRVYRGSAKGRQQTLARLAAGAAVYLPPAYAKDRSAPATAEASCPTLLLEIAQSQFRSVTSQSPALALAVMGELSGRLRHFVDLTHDLGLRTVRGRLSRFLVQESRLGHPVQLSHADIASSIGSVREVVSRAVGALERDGLIRVGRERIAVLDLPGLEALAEDR